DGLGDGRERERAARQLDAFGGTDGAGDFDRGEGRGLERQQLVARAGRETGARRGQALALGEQGAPGPVDAATLAGASTLDRDVRDVAVDEAVDHRFAAG